MGKDFVDRFGDFWVERTEWAGPGLSMVEVNPKEYFMVKSTKGVGGKKLEVSKDRINGKNNRLCVRVQ